MDFTAYNPRLLVAAGLLAMAFICAVGVLFLWYRQKPKSVPPLDPEPESVMPKAEVEAERELSPRELLQRVEDVLAAKLSHQTGILLESETRIKSELIEQACRVEILAESIRQSNKELAVVEQLLRDVLQILNISISETKGLSAKLQKHMDEKERVGAQALDPKPRQLR